MNVFITILGYATGLVFLGASLRLNYEVFMWGWNLLGLLG